MIVVIHAKLQQEFNDVAVALAQLVAAEHPNCDPRHCEKKAMALKLISELSEEVDVSATPN